jgi:hypothetical protein
MTSISCNSKVSRLEKTPEVSVIFTVTNEEGAIEHAIEYVLRVDYPDYGVTIVYSSLKLL